MRKVSRQAEAKIRCKIPMKCMIKDDAQGQNPWRSSAQAFRLLIVHSEWHK